MRGQLHLRTPFSRPEGRPEGVHLRELPLYCFNFLLPFHRFSKQYSKDYKAKEVSEGGETKDFWNVLGGKANFTSLSEGECCDALQEVIPPSCISCCVGNDEKARQFFLVFYFVSVRVSCFFHGGCGFIFSLSSSLDEQNERSERRRAKKVVTLGLWMQSYMANFSTGKKLGVSFPSLAKAQDVGTDISRE